MRAPGAPLIAILLGAGAVAAAHPEVQAARPCAGGLCARARLPAPIAIATQHGSFRIARDGHLIHSRSSAAPLPAGAIGLIARDTWFTFRRGHLIVGRGRGPIWRSRGYIGSRWRIGVILVGSRMIAFQHDHKLYLAPVRGAERAVASREMPIGWTTGGIYTYRYKGRELLLRSDTGRLLKVIARRPTGSDYYVAGGSLLYVSGGVVMSARGSRTRRLASLRRLGFAPRWLGLAPVGSMAQLQDDDHLVILRGDGSVFARTRFSRSSGEREGLSSSLALGPGARAVAFTTIAGPAPDPNAAHSTGIETVYLMRAGARTAIALHRERASSSGCEQEATLQWRGEWLLYSAPGGGLAAIDTSDTHRTIELSSRVRALAAAPGGFSASWAAEKR